MTEITVNIKAIGRRGEGIVRIGEDTVFVPHVLPGEEALIAVEGERGNVVRLLRESAERTAPFCPHFGRCGGCQLQHWQEEPYRAWKRGLVETAFRNRDIEATIDPLVDAHGRGRRRVVLHVRYEGGRARAGFMEARSHRLLDLDLCPILEPALQRAPDIARELGQVFIRATKTLDVQITASEQGLDCHIKGPRSFTLDQRMDLAEIAARLELARVTFNRELVVEHRTPVITMGRAIVPLPEASFLQATQEGEQVLASLALEMLGEAARIADLFCGVGPFALRLAERAAVHAVDGDGRAVAAMMAAARHVPGLKPLTSETRDLFKRPLIAQELSQFDAVLFDPPRAGAEMQAGMLAQSRVPVVVAISCDPATLARDAAILINGGYRLRRVVPVDQFKWSAHVETVASFER